MLMMDLRNLSRAQLVDAVSRHCGQFGNVETITVLRPPEQPKVAFALVSMTSSNDLDLVVNKLADAKISSLAVIKIEQETPNIPSSLLRGGRRQPGDCFQRSDAVKPASLLSA